MADLNIGRTLRRKEAGVCHLRNGPTLSTCRWTQPLQEHFSLEEAAEWMGGDVATLKDGERQCRPRKRG